MAVVNFTMEGGKPWGIRLTGGEGTGLPLKIASVTPGSKSFQKGVLPEMEILSINDNETAGLTMEQAQFIIKGAADKLTLALRRARNGDAPTNGSATASKPAARKDILHDDDFYADLRQSMAPPEERTGPVQGGTFRMMQDHVDAGQTGAVLSAFDKPKNWKDRNASIQTTAPKVQETADGQIPKIRTAVMEGGKPWGIRIQGGKGTDTPLRIANVQMPSKAYHEGIILNDVIVSINGHDCSELTMAEAQNLIKETGDRLELEYKSVNQPGVRVEKADDEKFFKDLQESVKGGNQDWTKRNVKGGAFKMLQTDIDTGNIKR